MQLNIIIFYCLVDTENCPLSSSPLRHKHLISPYNITPESNINLIGIKEIITN